MIIIIIIKIINNNDGSGRISFCPDLLVKLFNGILESGLTPKFVAPNSILPWAYPEGGGYARHCDSRHWFGDVVVGVTLGTSILLTFASTNKLNNDDDETPPPPKYTNHKIRSSSEN